MDIKPSVQRTLSSLKADLIFQTKQGFLAVYLVVAAIYIIILSQLPEKILGYAVPIVIFSDPSVLGLLFMGGMLMLEKEQGITNSLAVTPLKFYEYISSKAVSLGLISVAVSLTVSLSAYGMQVNYYIVITVVLLVSVLFTLIGYIIAQHCSGINQFLLKAVPYITLAVVPCFSLIGFKYSWLFYTFPTVSALKLLIGAYSGISPLWASAIIAYLILWDLILMMAAKRSYNNNFI